MFENIYDEAERRGMLTSMEKASNVFYGLAASTCCHPFIEFTGLMNEYIKVCEEAHEQGIDFSNATEHSGHGLPMKAHHADYLAEKFRCIFGPTFRENPEMWERFSQKVIDGE